MPTLGTNTVNANGALLNRDGHPCVIVNDEIHPSNGVHLCMQFLNDEIYT